jgi:hypothetical protein
MPTEEADFAAATLRRDVMRSKTSPSAPVRSVHFLACRPGAKAHDLAAQRDVARRLAALFSAAYQGDLEASANLPRGGYLVPNETLPSLAAARRLGVHSEPDLFGGVVPHPFVATKVISHGRVTRDSVAPEGWVDTFPERVRDAVLPGFSAFSLDDARRAGRLLLRDGPVRVKAAGDSGGAGQSVVRDEAGLETSLAALGAAIEQEGVVLERDLASARTYSIGLLQLGTNLRACYFGTQHNTLNRHGREVYGGSSINLFRGGFEVLDAAASGDADLHCAVALARRYHEEALACFVGMFASRCNYDVVLGEDEQGRPFAGVLEQSWRIGGASGAEVAALQRLLDDPRRSCVRAETVERHGAPPDAVPAGAIVGYAGNDPEAGPIVKYTLVHDDADGT